LKRSLVAGEGARGIKNSNKKSAFHITEAPLLAKLPSQSHRRKGTLYLDVTYRHEVNEYDRSIF
jgi:hypothetical protein